MKRTKRQKLYKTLAIALAVLGFFILIYSPAIFYKSEVGKHLLGQPVPNAALYDFNQNETSLSQILADRKSSKVVISFWASWCGPCENEMPLIESYQEKIKERGIDLILVNSDDGMIEKVAPEMKAWLITRRLEGLSTFFDPKGALLNAFKVAALPFHVGVSKNESESKVTWVELGEIDWRPEKIGARFE